jgi:hypothetical protein
MAHEILWRSFGVTRTHHDLSSLFLWESHFQTFQMGSATRQPSQLKLVFVHASTAGNADLCSIANEGLPFLFYLPSGDGIF